MFLAGEFAAASSSGVCYQRGFGNMVIFSGASRWRLHRWAAQIPQVAALEEGLKALDDRELRKQSLSLKYRAKSGEALAKLMPEAYALVREAGRRTLNMRHFDVQILGGIALFHRSIAEMQTGEGKTLTATLPLYLMSLEGKGAHLATVNDYLAKRDADWMRPIYEALGVSVGIIQTPDTSDQRRQAYACDVTYGTAKEFGFDFLRDRLLLRRTREQEALFLGEVTATGGRKGGEKPVQRESHFVLVDEADSILIDEARTPLIISALEGPSREQIVATYRWAAEFAPRFHEDQEYEYDHEKRKVELSYEGRQLLRSLPRPKLLDEVGLVDQYEYMERAIKVARDYQLDRHYVVREGEIVIVDEFTGRLAEGRKWRDGIHQAIEAKEKIDVTTAAGQAARITVQDLFLRYRRLAGMTGTATTSAREMAKIYKVNVLAIPTNRPAVRKRLPDRVFGVSEDKWRAIAEEVAEMHALGRPVLIGTRSIDKSELVSRMLTELGIEHKVLNARHIALEADIVAAAGQIGKVTVATNMAGRGTDIRLGPGVAELNGLHVICSEMHESARIDRQLIGRCGRQGDPGTYRQFLSLDDEILQNGLGPEKAKSLKDVGRSARNGACQKYAPLFSRAQRKVERDHLRQRMILMYHDRERKKLHREIGQDPYLDTPD